MYLHTPPRPTNKTSFRRFETKLPEKSVHKTPTAFSFSFSAPHFTNNHRTLIPHPQVQNVPSLPDRVAAVLAPHLQASPVNSTLLRPRRWLLTAAAAAVNASSSAGLKNASSFSSSSAAAVSNGAGDDVNSSIDAGSGVNVNSKTPLTKEGLLAALREVGVGVKVPPLSKRKGAKGGGSGGRRKKEPLGGLLTAIEVSCAQHLPPTKIECDPLQKPMNVSAFRNSCSDHTLVLSGCIAVGQLEVHDTSLFTEACLLEKMNYSTCVCRALFILNILTLSCFRPRRHEATPGRLQPVAN